MTCWAAALRPDPAMRSKWRLPSKLRANQKSAKGRSGLAVRAVEAMARGRRRLCRRAEGRAHQARALAEQRVRCFSLSAINRAGSAVRYRGRTPPRGAKALTVPAPPKRVGPAALGAGLAALTAAASTAIAANRAGRHSARLAGATAASAGAALAQLVPCSSRMPQSLPTFNAAESRL